MTIQKMITYRVTDGNNWASFQDIEGLSKEAIEQQAGFLITDTEYDVLVLAQSNAVIGYGALPAFLKTMTADEATAHIHSSVLGGKTVAEVDADIDALPSTVAGMKIGLKQIGASLVAIRDILELIVKLLLYIRDLVIKYRTQ